MSVEDALRGPQRAREPAAAGSPWRLVREAGLEYAASASRAREPALASPVAVERIPGVGHLIVDDVSIDGDPLRMRCRTLLLSFSGEVRFDSSAAGHHDAYGCAAGEGRIALLRAASRDLLVLSPSGALLRSIDVSGASTHAPRSVSLTPGGTFLVAFLGTFQEVDFAEFDANGRLLRVLPATRPAIGIPGSIQVLPDAALVVADEFHSVAWRVAADGSASILRGRFHHASAAPGDLHRPRCARLSGDGSLLVADTHNHRVLAVSASGAVERISPGNGEFLAPSFAERLPDGSVLVCDAGNRCVVEVDRAGRVAWSEGEGLVRRRHFSFPRSVVHRGGARYLVADSAHDRVVHADHGELRAQALDGGGALFWPRAACEAPGGNLLVADGRNGRVIEVASDGRLLRALSATRFEGREIAFRDPHDVRALPNGNLLVVDSAQHLVFETSWDGRAAWMLGARGEVRDPHSAQRIADGRILVSDPGHHRIVLLDPRTGTLESITELRSAEGPWRFRSPRYAGLAPDGTLAIADTGNSRVLLAELSGEWLGEVAHVPGSPRPELRFPRWVHVLGRDEIVISDYANHRIVHVQRGA